VLCDDSAEICSIHDKEQKSENRPLWNAIQDRHDWIQMTVERNLLRSAADEGREPPQDRVDETKAVLEAQQQQCVGHAVEGS